MTRIGDKNALLERTQYLELLTDQLGQKRVTLEYAERKITLAIELGHIAGSDQLLNAQRRARKGLNQFESHLKALVACDGLDWDQLRTETETALEECANSVRTVVARFP